MQNLRRLCFMLEPKKELSEVPARWELVEKAVRVRDAKKSDTLILGNGDVRDLAHARELCQKYGADGAMLGRAIFGNPWLFSERDPTTISLKEKLTVLREHVQLYDEHLGDIKPFDFMKKHFKSYMEGFPGAKKFREPFMKAKTASEILSLIDEVLAE
jgi:tRNA-dihydrouridine synthase